MPKQSPTFFIIPSPFLFGGFILLLYNKDLHERPTQLKIRKIALISKQYGRKKEEWKTGKLGLPQ